MTDEEKKASENRSEQLTRGAMLVAGAATAALGHTVEGALIFGATTELVNAAKALYKSPTIQNLQNLASNIPAWRVSKTFQSATEKIAAEGIEPDLGRMADLLEQAIPFVGNAQTEEKRQMMEDVILNAARRSKEAAAQIEAAEILAAIEDMPDPAALIFAEIVRLVKQIPSDQPQILTRPIPDCGFSSRIHTEALKYLGGDFHTASSRIPIQIEDRPGLIEDVDEKGGGMIFHRSGSYKYRLTSYGKWVADWITNNPSPKPTTEGDAPP